MFRQPDDNPGGTGADCAFYSQKKKRFKEVLKSQHVPLPRTRRYFFEIAPEWSTENPSNRPRGKEFYGLPLFLTLTGYQTYRFTCYYKDVNDEPKDEIGCRFQTKSASQRDG